MNLSEKRQYHLLAIVLVIASVLRLAWLGQREIWYDEAFSVLCAEKGFAAIQYGTISQFQCAAADVHPPLYYFLLHVWMGLGESLFIVRLLSAILGVATVGVSYLLGRELFGARAGLAGAFVVAISPFHIYYSQEARMYSLLGFLLTMGTYFFVRAVQTSKLRHWLGFTVCFALAQYTHSVAVFWLMALDACALLLYRCRPNVLKSVIAANVGVFLLCSPWLLFALPGQLSKVEQSYWIPVPGPAQLVRLLLTLTLNLPAPPALLVLWTFFAFLLLALVIQLAVHQLRREQAARSNLLFLAIIALLPVLAIFLVSQVRPIYWERLFIFSAIAYYLLVGWAVSKVKLSPASLLLGVPVLAVVGLALHYQYTFDQFPRSPYRSAVQYLRANYDPNSVIIHNNKLSFFPSYFWDRGLPQHFLPDPPGAPQDTLSRPTMETLGLFPDDLEQLTRGHDRVYLVVFRKAMGEAHDRGKPLPDMAWLESHFDKHDVVSFNDLEVYVFRRAGKQ
ncbi:MAG: glycosyltransferase family 39 protein [Chloroflexi bacterium]|nr:glycosyltransferase family 39 protein [Chloroflexota bacterium]